MQGQTRDTGKGRTMKLSRTPLAIITGTLLLAGCSPEAVTDNLSDNANNAAAPVNETAIMEDGDSMAASSGAALTDGWAGRWTGPEGLFLDITPAAPGQYRLTIKADLDSQGEYVGAGQGDTIRFERGGVTETIRAGTGAETGFKYLADKTSCLIVQPDKEGYCR